MIQPILSNERGDSVRGKLNAMVELVARGTAYKPADESRTAITILPDADLILPVLANESYLVRYGLTVAIDNPSLNFHIPTVIGNARWFSHHAADGQVAELGYNSGPPLLANYFVYTG